jgi:hypothetical protein
MRGSDGRDLLRVSGCGGRDLLRVSGCCARMIMSNVVYDCNIVGGEMDVTCLRLNGVVQS